MIKLTEPTENDSNVSSTGADPMGVQGSFVLFGRSPAYSGLQHVGRQQAQCTCPWREEGNWLVYEVCARRAGEAG